VRLLADWLTALPHPALAVEISPSQIAAVRWSRAGLIEGVAVEPLPPGALVASPVETNLVDVPALRTALTNACRKLQVKDEPVTLLLPDPVIRVFVQHFDDFPRAHREALPMLRWKLRKSIPFEIDDAILSYNRQIGRKAGIDVVTVLARQRIVREYEQLAESAGMFPGVILSSSLAALTLLDARKPTLFARVSGTTLTTVIVQKDMLCGYRCTELSVPIAELTPKMFLDEIYPMAAYFQDTWQEGIQSVRVSGVRLAEVEGPLRDEFHCGVLSSLNSAVSEGRVPESAQPLVDRGLEGLLGWMMNRG
jgi:type IV pilus assembly protein PilM